MPRIQSRLHADELQSTKRALAEVEADNKTLRQQVEKQQAALSAVEAKNATLHSQLAQARDDVEAAHLMLSEVQTHYEDRERCLREQFHRMELDIHTLEEMVQTARRREAAGNTAKNPSVANDTSRDEWQSLQAGVQRCETEAQATYVSSFELTQQPSSCPPRAAVPPTAAPVPAAALARSFYWQDQLLHMSQEAAACFDLVRRRTHDLCGSYGINSQNDDRDAAGKWTPRGALDDTAKAWTHQLQHLQSSFDEVVHADAKLISFLVLVGEQQSSQIQQLRRRWSEAQRTLQEAEKVLGDAQARAQAREREVEMLRQECATLTDAQLRHQAQLAAQSREAQNSATTLRRYETEHRKEADAHLRQVEDLSAQLKQVSQLHRQATRYAHKLEAALQEKQQLLDTAVVARTEQQKREVLAATEARVAHFVAQLNQSAQQLRSSLLVHNSSSPQVRNEFTTPCRASQVRAAPSVSSPEPSPPGGLRSAAGVSLSLSPSVTCLGARSPSLLPYDDSISLVDLTQPFAFDS
ncbi:hypothetical protein N2W54_005333 [Lotmaria passim]